MDLSAFSAVVGGLNQAYQSAKALLELKVETEAAARINALVHQLGDLSSKFIAAQAAHMQCQERTMQLEKELTRLEQFESQKQRYRLAELAPGVLAYALKPEHAAEEPAHHLCAACYAQAQARILQFQRQDTRNRIYKCFACGAEYPVPHNIQHLAEAVPRGGHRSL